MVFNILSIGDGEMLANAFEGVAMIFGSGSMTNIAKTGSLLRFLSFVFGICAAWNSHCTTSWWG